MTDSKPKVFIGSSTSGFDIAEKVKGYLSPEVDCHTWKDNGVWVNNFSTFDNLLRIATYYDFGVFIATSDDLTLSEGGDIFIEPRDNVILEMALFLGALGRDKSFLLVEEGVKLPSDFNGIYMPRFLRNDEHSISSEANEFLKKIKEHFRLGYLSLYPTTALALGYYKNFVEGIVDRISEIDDIHLDGKIYNDFKLKIVLPLNLKGNIRQKATRFYKRNNFQENTLNTRYRKQPAWFHFDPSKAPLGSIYDMPSTLSGIDDAIEMVLRKGYVGRSAMQEIIEERELNNFKRVLQMQIDKNPLAQEIVEIVDEF